MIRNSKTITRFAPSPTGLLHIGTARTALFNFAAARQTGGQFVVRMEDTDKTRSKKEYEDDILAGLEWFGLPYDALYRQSERDEVYEKHLETLLASGAAFESEEERDGKKSAVVRFKNPNKKVAFTDEIRGEISFDTTELGDFVIARSKTDPLYHLAVVVDDYDMGVTHVIRGEDHISNTPRQVLLQDALGAPRPLYAHIPLILAPDRSKLSKRHGAISVNEYKKQGYLPEALINFMALLGWSPQKQQTANRKPETANEDIFTLEELIKSFSLKDVQKSGAIFNIQKLNWINREHMKRLPEDGLQKQMSDFLPEEIRKLPQWSEERFLRLAPIIAERVETFGELENLRQEGELAYFFAPPDYKAEKLAWKDTRAEETKRHIDKSLELLQSVSPENFTQDTVKEALWDYAEGKGRGNVLWPVRFALSGRDKSPDPFTVAYVLGKDETVMRLKNASLKLRTVFEESKGKS